MNSPIKSPSNPDFPPASNDLSVDSFNGLPTSYRWGLRVGPDDDGNYRELIAGNGSLTEKQWSDWTTQPDSYVLECAATNLGLTLV